MQQIAKDGVVVTNMGSHIVTSTGKQYTLSGTVLLGPGNQVLSQHCQNIDQAFGLVMGKHGGYRF